MSLYQIALQQTNRVHSSLPLSENIQLILQHMTQDAATEQVVVFGRWWFESSTGYMVLSHSAANLLEVTAGFHDSCQQAFSQVTPDTAIPLLTMLQQSPLQTIDCEVKIINAKKGVRWLKVLSLPHHNNPAIKMGVVQDITLQKLALMREKFSFTSSQFLVGAQSISVAVTKVIQLVC